MSLSKPLGKKAANTKQPVSSSGNPAIDLFHRHWQAIEKQQLKLDKQAREGETIYQRFQTDIEPLERQQCDLIFQLAQRLVSFTARKSFTQWQRETLHDWVIELITYLESNPFRGEMELDTLFAGIQANTVQHFDDEMIDQQCDFIRDMLNENLGHCPFDDQQLREMVKNPELLREHLMKAAEGHAPEETDGAEPHDNPFEQDEWQAQFADDEPFEPGPHDDYARANREREQAERVKHLFSKSSLKQLYRKLALALHPDRETDPAKQEEKTLIMGQLSQAWEKQEMFTVLQLAHTYLPEAENLLSEENLAYINPLLKQHVRELELEFFKQRTYPQGLQGIVAHKFKQSSKKKTEQAFVDHQDYLLRDIASLNNHLATITTLQTLKPYLSARWEQQQQAVWDDEPDLDWLFK